jgi:hypothetical protein
MNSPLLPPPACKTATRPYKRTSAAAFAGDAPDPDDPLLGFAPYLHKAPRRNSITPERQRAFIAALAATGIVTQAARTIGASLEALYSLRNRKGAAGFAAAWEQALLRGLARLEDCALERAIQGEERVIVGRGGEVVARWVRYDTSLITFMLRQRRGGRPGGGGLDPAELQPGHPVYERMKAEWVEQEQLRKEQAARAMIAENDKFLLRLNAALERKRREAIAAGLMVLDAKGQGTFAGMDDP